MTLNDFLGLVSLRPDIEKFYRRPQPVPFGQGVGQSRWWGDGFLRFDATLCLPRLYGGRSFALACLSIGRSSRTWSAGRRSRRNRGLFVLGSWPMSQCLLLRCSASCGLRVDCHGGEDVISWVSVAQWRKCANGLVGCLCSVKAWRRLEESSAVLTLSRGFMFCRVLASALNGKVCLCWWSRCYFPL